MPLQVRIRWTAIAAVATVFAAACGGGEGGETGGEAPPADAPAAQPAPAARTDLPEGVTEAMIAEGREIFSGQGICMACHGPDATGTDLAPDLTDDTWLNTDGSYEGIVEIVTNGVPEPREHPGLMQPRAGTAITDEQVRAVAAYVWSLSH